jgi:hypothetical protein
MNRVRTSLLVVLLIAASLSAWLALAHLAGARDRANTSARDLATSRKALAALRGARAATPTAANDSNPINSVLREAASASGASAKLASIEPGQSAAIAGTDYDETPVFLRIDPMPLRPLVTFLHAASARDPRVRCRSIELSAGDSPDAWSADITLAYLSHSARGAQSKGSDIR